jgi:hypothetical protein
MGVSRQWSVTYALHAHAITTQEDIPKVNDFTAFELQLVLWHAFVQTMFYGRGKVEC